MDKIGFIGTGTMGRIVAQVVASNTRNEKDTTLYFSNRSPQKAIALSKELEGIFSTNQIIAQDCTLIFLGVKPQMLDELLAEISPILSSRKDKVTLVSMLAGVTTATLSEKSGRMDNIIRMMPNTPLAVREGVIQYCGREISSSALERFATLLQGAGLVDEVLESQMDSASALSGCGPAFCAMFLEALSDGGVFCGLPRDKALTYAAQTLLGTAKLYLEEGIHPAQLKDSVCSPSGSTISGVSALESLGFRGATIQAVTQSYQRTQALGNTSSK